MAAKCVTKGCKKPQSLRSDEGLCAWHRPGTLMLGGMVSLKAQREYGKTGRELGKEMRGDFKKRKGYDPEPAGDKNRWW